MKIYSRLAVTFLFTVGLVAPAPALVIVGGEAGHTNAPADDPGWNNVGSVRSPKNKSRAGVVYLCDNWFITTYHAWSLDSPTGVVVGASGYPVDTNSMIRLTNSISGMNTNADVALFRVTQKPALPPLNITTMTPGGLWVPVNYGGNKTIIMIGSGHPREEAPSYWKVVGTNWTQSTASDFDYSGYKFWGYTGGTDDTSRNFLRWGSNQVYTTDYKLTMPSSFGDVMSFVTQFNTNAGPDECQIAPIDSGGGVFYKNNGYWELTGLMSTMSQPDMTDPKTVKGIANGGYSFIADLSYYRDQILAIIAPANGWPDLAVQFSQTSRRLQQGESIDILITTTNMGTGIASNHVTTVQWSTAGQTNQTDHNIPLLSGGQSVTYTNTFATNTPGTYTLRVDADAANSIYEPNEPNNTKTIVFQVGPDLLISGAPGQAYAGPGGEVLIKFVIKNDGSNNAAGPFDIALYHSTNDNFSSLSEAELLPLKLTASGRISGTNLPAGGVSTNSISFSAPAEPGNYYIRARIDSSNTVAESSETNNWGGRTTLRVGPDLIIDGQLLFTTKAAGGGTNSINIVTKNDGDSTAFGPFETALYLSTNYSLTAPGEAELSGMKVLAKVPLSTMPRWSFSTNTFSFTAPTNAGTYYMRARTDASNTVAEASEANNWGPPLVLQVGPDLIVSDVWPTATNAAAGASVSIQVVTKNDGAGASSGPFETALYWSTNNNLTTRNESELRNLTVSDPVSIPGLSANASSTNSFTFNAPLGTGTYYLRARTDPSNTVTESLESNNWGPLFTVGVGPDLVIAGSSPGTTNAAAGSSVSIQVFTKNQGTSDVTNDFVLGFYLITSSNAGGDTPIKEQTIQGLPAGKSVTNTFTFTAPTNNGRYRLIAKADDYDSSTNKGAVAEAYETNNEGTSPGQYSILYIGPDLSVAFAKTNTVRAIANSSVTLDVSLRNNGGQDTTGVDTTLYLSSTNTFAFATYTNLQTKASAIAGYASWTEPFEFRAPRKPGTYYLIAQVDASRRIAETDENNNLSEILTLEIVPALPWLNLLLE